MNTRTLNLDTGELDYDLIAKQMWGKGEPMDEQTEGGEQAIVFSAVLYKTSTDHDGETRVQLDVPRSDLEDMAQLMGLGDVVMKVRITVESKQLSFAS
jgi:hypothetical protein